MMYNLFASPPVLVEANERDGVESAAKKQMRMMMDAMFTTALLLES